ncbi:hypothetical protein [Neptunomonas phycophila]|uniref:hypothetical protein n=1 Tax=Neptunomonas phycophila TaxID=1572645 RepID=UPI003512E551
MITFVTDVVSSSESAILVGAVCCKCLEIHDLGGQLLKTVPAPVNGWTHERLQEQAMILSSLTIDGVLGIFRPKTTKNAEAPAPQSLQEGITFS